MNQEQIEAYNELGKLLVEKLGCTSQEANNKIANIMESLLEVLEQPA